MRHRLLAAIVLASGLGLTAAFAGSAQDDGQPAAQPASEQSATGEPSPDLAGTPGQDCDRLQLDTITGVPLSVEMATACGVQREGPFGYNQFLG